jgi:hypothetical protein
MTWVRLRAHSAMSITLNKHGVGVTLTTRHSYRLASNRPIHSDSLSWEKQHNVRPEAFAVNLGRSAVSMSSWNLAFQRYPPFPSSGSMLWMAASRRYTYVREMPCSVSALSYRRPESNFNVSHPTLNLSPWRVTWCPCLSLGFCVLFNMVFRALSRWVLSILCVSESINNLVVGFHALLNHTSLLIIFLFLPEKPVRVAWCVV